MAHLVEFTKADKVNGQKYKKGDILSVSSSIYKTLKENSSVKNSKQKED